MGRAHATGTTGLQSQLPAWSSIVTTGMTISCWAYIDTLPANFGGQTPISRCGQFGGPLDGLVFYRVDSGAHNRIEISLNNTVVREPYALNTWYYCALVQDIGTTFNLTWYFYDNPNSTWYSTTTTGNTATTLNNVFATIFCGGRNGSATNQWKGDIGCARVFMEPLTQAMLDLERPSALAVRTSSIYADWTLSGATLADSSGKGHPLTLAASQSLPTAGSLDPPVSAADTPVR